MSQCLRCSKEYVKKRNIIFCDDCLMIKRDEEWLDAHANCQVNENKDRLVMGNNRTFDFRSSMDVE